MSRKKSSSKKKPRKPKVCPNCQGQGVVIEECMNCMGFRCLECDGQGYLVFDCELCHEKRTKEQAAAKKRADKLIARRAMKKEMSKPGKTAFERDGLTFTYISETDLTNIVKMLAKKSVCEYVFFGPNTEQETRAYFEPLVTSIQSALGKGERPAEHVFTIRKDGVFVGQCALLPVAFSPGNFLLGLTIDDTHWRHGIGEKSCRSVPQRLRERQKTPTFMLHSLKTRRSVLAPIPAAIAASAATACIRTSPGGKSPAVSFPPTPRKPTTARSSISQGSSRQRKCNHQDCCRNHPAE